MVEASRIELESRNKLQMASTSLEKLLKFNLASHNLQSYTRRASKFILRRDTLNIYLHKGYTSNPIYPESIGEAARPLRGGKTYATA